MKNSNWTFEHKPDLAELIIVRLMSGRSGRNGMIIWPTRIIIFFIQPVIFFVTTPATRWTFIKGFQKLLLSNTLHIAWNWKYNKLSITMFKEMRPTTLLSKLLFVMIYLIEQTKLSQLKRKHLKISLWFPFTKKYGNLISKINAWA